MKYSVLTIIFFILFSIACSSTKTTKTFDQSAIKISHFTMNNTPEIGKTLSGQTLRLGGFSGLAFLREEGNFLYFQTVTDRGPNGEMKDMNRPFLLPDYSPRIVTLKLDKTNSELSVTSEIHLKKKNGSSLTGLPNQRIEENPVDVFGLAYSIDTEGLDMEGLVADGEGGWWVSDEYGPSLVHFDSLGILLRRALPANELPRMYSSRKNNRGFEGIAKQGQKLYGILQSPLPGDAGFTRIVEMDLDSMKTSAEYFYTLDEGSDKIGDMVSVNEKTFFVLEQNGKTGDKSKKAIYRIELGQSDEMVKKAIVTDLKTTSFHKLEKLEGLAIVDKHRLALIYDNDFQLNGPTDYTSGLTPLNEAKNQMVILEFKEELY